MPVKGGSSGHAPCNVRRDKMPHLIRKALCKLGLPFVIVLPVRIYCVGQWIQTRNATAFNIVTAEAPLHLNGKSPLILLRETRGGVDSPA